jgi:hypothetical protein
MLIARALLGKDGDCPTIEIAGSRGTMELRNDPRAVAFGRMCESRRPLGEAMDVRIRQGRTVLLEQHITRRPSRVLAVGDTGCRVTSYYDQMCSDAERWPFAQLAASAAAQSPDLILHLGDYYYRETPCKGSDQPCFIGAYGDREEAWRADFFVPARPLLAKAPWIFVRGNHEDCTRGGIGYYYYFGEGTVGCELVHPPTRIAFKGWSLVQFDSAHTDDPFAIGPVNQGWLDLADTLRTQKPGDGPVLLATHEPGYFTCTDNKTLQRIPCRPQDIAAVGDTRTIGDAVRSTGARTIMISGHLHAFELLDTPQITQVIVGNGGASPDMVAKELEPPASGEFSFKDLRLALADGRWRAPADGPTVSGTVQGWAGFGFAMLMPASFELVMHDKTGKRLFACNLAKEGTTPRCR